MKKHLIIILALMLASCAGMNRGVKSEAETQDQLLLATLWYQESAEMKALYYQCYNNALLALQLNMGNKETSKPPAVVLDIDETVLDNSPFQGWQIKEGKPFSQEAWNSWVSLSAAQPLPGAVEFTRSAEELGAEVFYISNRSKAQAQATIENMQKYGFASADTVHLLLKDSTSVKTGRREALVRNYEIVLFVGDNLADMNDIWEERGNDLGTAAVEKNSELFGTEYIILPNPMYGGWLNAIMKKAEGATVRERIFNSVKSF